MYSNRRVEIDKGGWIPVGAKRINRDELMKKNRISYGNGNEVIFTLFIDNLPEDANQSWLKKLFSSYGVVKDAFIPEKRSKATGRMFGFVRYNCSVSADVAISKAHGMWCNDRKLFVKYASFSPNQQRKTVNLKNGHDMGVGVVASHGNVHNRGVKLDSFFGSTDKGALQQQNTGTSGYKSYAQTLKGENFEVEEKREEKRAEVESLTIQPSSNEWLYRSARARIQIATVNNSIINDWIDLEINGVIHRVKVMEEQPLGAITQGLTLGGPFITFNRQTENLNPVNDESNDDEDDEVEVSKANEDIVVKDSFANVSESINVVEKMEVDHLNMVEEDTHKDDDLDFLKEVAKTDIEATNKNVLCCSKSLEAGDESQINGFDPSLSCVGESNLALEDGEIGAVNSIPILGVDRVVHGPTDVVHGPADVVEFADSFWNLCRGGFFKP
ncbi:hypothetical protein Vadar_006570 [Vaccinium darrowii]|uniref:Uncharacterized protein n=1 Tax=Vaccinium darrowii TaxID=229202 RepID=A0ACB7XYI2_9ERIC|nr:hypothetical protein Vadar_006570 [Vaccinium darrowii]